MDLDGYFCFFLWEFESKLSEAVWLKFSGSCNDASSQSYSQILALFVPLNRSRVPNFHEDILFSSNSHTVGFSNIFTLPSQSLQGFFPSFHCTSQQRVELNARYINFYQIRNSFSEIPFRNKSQTVSQQLEICAILCKRKDVKRAEESQPNGPRSRYEPY